MPALSIQINHSAGLHARPLAQFVKIAKSFNTSIQVTNITTGKGPMNGASPVNLMLLAVQKGNSILIETNGEQAEEALQALKSLIEMNFGEG
jgi:phosphotransferase system HPr (HPr) family protein